MLKPERVARAYEEGATIVIAPIISALFAAEDRRVQSWLDRICARNRELNKITEPVGFLHDGVIYRPSVQGKGRWPVKLIHHSLEKEMDELLKSQVSANRDRQSIRQVLFALLKGCNGPQDIRDALPECLISAVPAEFKLASLHRSNEPAWSIQGDPRALDHYEKMLPKLELYSATRFIY